MSGATALAARPVAARPVTIAVAGNPNSGKSTLINAIAGSRLHVGNWPGVTVEKKEATFEHAGRTVRLVDLPGTYSLSPYSQEELVARDYLAHERPDVVVNVVDATNLERNLYLTVQLLELGLPVVIALNIFDEAQAKGYRFDVAGSRIGSASPSSPPPPRAGPACRSCSTGPSHGRRRRRRAGGPRPLRPGPGGRDRRRVEGLRRRPPRARPPPTRAGGSPSS